LTGKKWTALFLLFVILAVQVHAQTTTTQAGFDQSTWPQWLRDIRRWEIVAFGSIPFTMFTATFAMDMYRWNNANGMDFSDAGRRYAPWPLKSAGAPAMDNKEMETTIIIAACLSIGIAVADQIIFQVKRNRARRRAEALPVGTLIINRTPIEEPVFEDTIEEETVPIP